MEINIKDIKDVTLEYLQNIDEELKNNRDKKRYKLVRKRDKYFFYNNQKYHFSRRYYYDVAKKIQVCLFDKFFKYEKKQHLSENDKKHIYELVAKEKMTFNQVIKALNLDISKSTISRIISKYKSVYETNFEEQTNSFNNLYIDIDDTYTYLKINNKAYKFKCKLLHSYQHYIKKDKHFVNEVKAILINKCYISSFTNSSWTNNQIKEILSKYYGDLNQFNLIVSGDGARYIKTIANNLNANVAADQWHLINKIHLVFNIKNESKHDLFFHNKKLFRQIKTKYRNEIVKLIKETKIDEAILILSEFKYKFNFKVKEINGLILYLKRNKRAIEIWSNANYFGTYTETFVQQLVKSYFGNFGKCYSLNNFINLLSANCVVKHLN